MQMQVYDWNIVSISDANNFFPDRLSRSCYKFEWVQILEEGIRKSPEVGI
jgi:hypothetical protein